MADMRTQEWLYASSTVVTYGPATRHRFTLAWDHKVLEAVVDVQSRRWH
jgi:hypothetical protein